ncbi:MAG TPA: fluoride efflux transporter CrcB [Jatrophihabitans sp.]
MIALMVALGAAVGAPARYLTDRAVQTRHRSSLPLGTFAVNVVASLVLGIVAGAAGHVSEDVAALVGTGFCGALSTFSTFGYETIRLAQSGKNRGLTLAAANVAISLVLGIVAAALGWTLGSAF